MVTIEHRKPLAAFLVMFVAACVIMGNGVRTQVVEVLIQTGAPNELISSVAPDMVLGQTLDGPPQAQAGAGKLPAVHGPVPAGGKKKKDLDAAKPSTTQTSGDATVRASTPTSVQPPSAGAPGTAESTRSPGRSAWGHTRRHSGQGGKKAGRKPAAHKPRAQPAHKPPRAKPRPAPKPAPKRAPAAKPKPAPKPPPAAKPKRAPKPAGARPAPAPKPPRGDGKAGPRDGHRR